MRMAACCREVQRKKPLPCLRSGDADGAWASEVEHAVENLHGDGDLGGLCLVGMEAQGIADDARPPPDLALHASVVHGSVCLGYDGIWVMA